MDIAEHVFTGSQDPPQSHVRHNCPFYRGERFVTQHPFTGIFMNLAGRLASIRFCLQTSCKSRSSEGFDCWLPRLLTRSGTRALLGAVQAGSVVNVLPVPV